MNPQEEQRLIEEVIYLHSLWHRGPPSPTPNPLHIASASQPYIPHYQRHYLIPTHPFAPTHTRSLPPITTTFHKRNRDNSNNKRKKKRKRKGPINNIRQPDRPQSPGPDWPCPASPDTPPTGWPAMKRCLVTPAASVSPQEKERLVALQAQNKACQAFRDFLIDSEGDDGDDDDDDDDDVGNDGWEELEEFFVKVFMEDDGLRGYYQRCSESGEFCCLVCGAIGKKNSGKRFKDCVALVQHSMSISRTMKKRAHRAFGMGVCKVLGWDIDRLPTIVKKGESLGGCSKGMKPSEAEGEAVESAADDGKDGPHKSDDEVVSLENNNEPLQKHAQLVDQGISEDEPEKPADCHVDDSSVLQENQAK